MQREPTPYAQRIISGTVKADLFQSVHRAVFESYILQYTSFFCSTTKFKKGSYNTVQF